MIMMLAMKDKLKKNPAVTLITKFRIGEIIILYFILKQRRRSFDLLVSVGSSKSCFLIAS